MQEKIPEVTLIRLETVESTNTHAHELAVQGCDEWTVVTAEYQTGGRGRFGRKWVSPKGKDLLFSIMLRPEIEIKKAPLITLMVAESLVSILDNCLEGKTRLTIKKPNDIIANGKKLAGILVESANKGKDLDFVIIGIGINVNSTRAELIETATSFLMETGRKFDRENLLSEILYGLRENYINKWRRELGGG